VFIDASAIVAILMNEEEGSAFEQAVLKRRGKMHYSPIAVMEATLAIARIKHKPTKARPKPDKDEIEMAHEAVMVFIEGIEAKPTPITNGIGNKAIEAMAKYGKAVGHKADLNMGDCYAYACAKAYRVPLLYKGDDFSKTDLK